MIFNKRININLIRTWGTKRFHYFKYQETGRTGVQVGVTIIQGRIGFIIYMWVTDVQKVLKKRLQEKNETIDDLIDTIKMVMGR